MTHYQEHEKRYNDRRFLRTFVVVSTILMGLLFWLAGATNAQAVALKHDSLIKTNTITLGDVFYGLSHGADRVLGPAPRPGQDMVLNARTLMRIALAMDVDWRPASAGDYVVLRRAATLVGRSHIEDALRSELKTQGLGGKYNLIFTGEDPHMVLPESENATVEISNIQFDRNLGRFSADLVAPSRDTPLATLRVNGKLQRLIDVPVLRNPLQNGDVIGKNDIDHVALAENLVQHDVVINADDLIGMTPRRMAYAGEPLKLNDIEAPRIVSRGETITMILRNGPLMLTAQGRALENGAKGDIVRVVNTASKRTIEGMVSGNREVTVQTY